MDVVSFFVHLFPQYTLNHHQPFASLFLYDNISFFTAHTFASSFICLFSALVSFSPLCLSVFSFTAPPTITGLPFSFLDASLLPSLLLSLSLSLYSGALYCGDGVSVTCFPSFSFLFHPFTFSNHKISFPPSLRQCLWWPSLPFPFLTAVIQTSLYKFRQHTPLCLSIAYRELIAVRLRLFPFQCFFFLGGEVKGKNRKERERKRDLSVL